MKVLTFQLTAQQPLLLTSLQGDPNSSVSFPYVPGSVIRGALIGRYIQQHCQENLFKPSDAQVQRLFFNAYTRYLNAYLFAEHQQTTQQRLLPVQRAWAKEKQNNFKRYERQGYEELWPCYERSSADVDSIEEPQPVLDRSTYCWIDRSTVSLYEVKQHINIHNQRDRKAGRGRAGSGEIFRYQAIAPWQTFQAVILIDAHDDTHKDEVILRELLEQDHHMWVGGSRSAGYGHVLISSKVQVVETWHEVGSSPIERGHIAEPYEADVDEADEDDYQEVDPSPLTHELHITLLSDMVVRNAYGQYDATFPVDALVQQLGLGREELQAVPARSFIATTSHGGFNRTWGLPMPQTLALASGSVLVFTLSQPLDTTRVAMLEAHGLGERRVEGFGRVAVNWRPGAASFRLLRITRSSVRLTSSSNGDTETSIENATPSLFREEHTRLAQFMARRVFRQQMEKQMVDQVERCTIYGEISNTQLSRLRIVARRALIRLEGQQATSVQHIMEDVQQLLDTLPQNARHQFETARIQEHSLMKWLKIRINEPIHDWQDQMKPVVLASNKVNLDERLACEYTLRLIMAVAKQAVKQKEIA